MSKILVTGAAGFIGSVLSEKLLALGHSVVGLDNFDDFYARSTKLRNLSPSQAQDNYQFLEMDLSQASSLAALPEDIEVLVHLAAKAGIQPSLKDPAAYIQHNIQSTQNLLDWMKQHDKHKLVFASSSSVYGNNKSIPFRESDSVDFPISPYAFTKKSCELMNHTYHHLYDIDILNLRFFTVYGPRQRPDLAIHKFLRMIKNNQAITMYGDGSSARDYTFIEDTVQGIIQSIEYLQNNQGVYEILNLGNNTPVKLKTLIHEMFDLLGKTPQVQELPMPPGDVDITYADISRAQALLSYQPKTDLRTGLQKFIDWYEQKD